MNEILARWNATEPEEAESVILPCCGSRTWAHIITGQRPFGSEESLFEAADLIWKSLPQEDRMEAYASHPRIGQRHAAATAQSLAWSAAEQGQAINEAASEAALADGNRRYEERFGNIFIVCASGKSGAEMLEILEERMKNDAGTEMLEAAEQQRQITQLRLRKWLRGQ